MTVGLQQPVEEAPQLSDENDSHSKEATLASGTQVTPKSGDPASRTLTHPALGGLSVRGNFNFGIPTKEGARDYVEEYHGKESWRMRVLEFLHERKVQYTLMSLLLLDVIILFIELFLLTQFPMCAVIERDCVSCCPAMENDEHQGLRFLLGETEHHGDICEEGLRPDFTSGGCDPHKWKSVHTAELVFFSVTIVILSIFFIELNLEMLALHPGVFFRQFFFTLDYVIVTVSLTLELSLHFVEEDSLATLLGLLVFARVWRFIRIGHGIVEVTSELTHKKYEKLLTYTRELEVAARKGNVELPYCPHSVQKALLEENSSSHDSESSLQEAKP